jgi:hypothetical protein
MGNLDLRPTGGKVAYYLILKLNLPIPNGMPQNRADFLSLIPAGKYHATEVQGKQKPKIFARE